MSTELAPEIQALRAALMAALDGVALPPVAAAHARQLVVAYCATRDALDALSGDTVSSYSIGQRSYTRRDLAALQERLAQLAAQLASALPAATPLLPPPAAQTVQILFP